MIDFVNALCESGYDFDMAIIIAEQFETCCVPARLREEPSRKPVEEDVERIQP